MSIKVEGLDKTEAWSTGTMLAPGRHYVTIVEANEGQSSGGHPQIELEFSAGNGGGSIRDWLTVTPAALGKVRQFLDALLVEPKPEMELNPTEFVGKKLYVTVGEEPDYNDPRKMRRRVLAYEAMSASDVDKARDATQPDDEGLPF